MYICAPTLIYLIFSISQVFIDTFQGLYNTAFMKTIVMILFALLLNLLCDAGMGVISWIIVLIPFLFMSVIVAILLYSFGLDPQTGEIDNEDKGGNLIFSIDSNADNNDDNENNENESVKNWDPIPTYTSDPQYESFLNIKNK